MLDLIRKALKPYKLENASIVIEKELHETSWNKDLHYKIVVDGKAFSARFIGYERSPHKAFGELSDELLEEQTRFCRFLAKNQIPFMRLYPISADIPFAWIEWKNKVYRFILFEWIEGQHITHCDVHVAEAFGSFSRRVHDISSRFTSSVFPKKSHLVGYGQFVEELRHKMNTTNLSAGHLKTLNEYLELVEHHTERARTEEFDFIIQSDLNPLNVIWDHNRKVA
jgi:Ser/Thr protein kinase RdoA (MazF antagonist)